MDKPEIQVKVKIAWWFKWYMLGVWAMARFCKAFGLPSEPNPDRVEYWASRAIKIVSARRNR